MAEELGSMRITLGCNPPKENRMKAMPKWGVEAKGGYSDQRGQGRREASEGSIHHLRIECTATTIPTALIAK